MTCAHQGIHASGRDRGFMGRTTIKDIARVAGVSPGAVSFALNDKPGVSEATRARIKAVAKDMGWRPNVAAKALSVNRAGAVGLVIARDDRSFAGEGFFLHLIAGMEEVLTPARIALVLQLVGSPEEECEVHRQWWAQHRVDGVVQVDPARNDPRWSLMSEINMPCTVVGATEDTPLPGIHIDDATAARSIVNHLADQGHRRIAHIGGDPTLEHSMVRRQVFAQEAESRGVVVIEAAASDYSEQSGIQETSALLSRPDRPTVIVYDNEVLTLGGITSLTQHRLRIPADVSVVSFEDSPTCRVIPPGITALRRDPSILGRDAVAMLMSIIDGQDVEDITEQPPELVVRGSTGQL